MNSIRTHTFRTCLFFPSSTDNWRPFCSVRRSLMPSDNVLCFICTPVAQCWSVTMYWLLQTDFVDIVPWSCSSSVIMPPKYYYYNYMLCHYTVCLRIRNVKYADASPQCPRDWMTEMDLSSLHLQQECSMLFTEGVLGWDFVLFCFYDLDLDPMTLM